MEKAVKIAAVVIVAALINKYAVRRFWALPAATTTTATT